MTRRQFICLLFFIVTIGLSQRTEAQEQPEIYPENEDDGDAIVEDEPEESQQTPYESPQPSGHVLLAEHFDNPAQFDRNWIKSQAKKEDIDEDIAKYDGIKVLPFIFF